MSCRIISCLFLRQLTVNPFLLERYLIIGELSLRLREKRREGWDRMDGPSVTFSWSPLFLSSCPLSRAREAGKRNWEPVTAPKKETVDDRLPVP